jgi:hypothetical protein
MTTHHTSRTAPDPADLPFVKVPTWISAACRTLNRSLVADLNARSQVAPNRRPR